jgi:hypothetical protein
MAKRSAPRLGGDLLGTSGLLVALAVTAVTMAGCGHPATREECDEIFNRSAEIELRMQNVTDPKIVAERIAAARKDRGEDLVQNCVGKRITTDAIACVQRAKTSEDMDQCLE